MVDVGKLNRNFWNSVRKPVELFGSLSRESKGRISGMNMSKASPTLPLANSACLALVLSGWREVRAVKEGGGGNDDDDMGKLVGREREEGGGRREEID